MTSKSQPLRDSWIRVLQINSIEYSYDKSIIVVATSQGYRVYDSANYIPLSRIDDNQDKIGPITKASVFHKSQLVGFLGSEQNKVYRPNQLVIWNDYLNEKYGAIRLDHPIGTFSILTYAICVFVPYSLLIFNIVNLEYVLKLEDLPAEACLVNFIDNNPLMIANCSNLNKKIIKLSSFSIKDNKLFEKSEMKLKTDFDDIQNISFGRSLSLLIIASKNGHRIHIYNTNTYRLKYCINLSQQANISNYCFDVKEKYFMFTINYNEVKVYKMFGRRNSYSYKCLCGEKDNKHSDNKKKSSHFNNLFHKMFGDGPNEFASYRFRQAGLCKLFMNPLSKTVLSLIFYNGYVSQLQLNRKYKNNINFLKEIVWLK